MPVDRFHFDLSQSSRVLIRRLANPELHRRNARLSSSRMTKDSVQWAKRHVPVLSGSLKSSIKRKRTRHGSDIYIEYRPTRRRGKSNSSTGRYWLWLLGTHPRFILRGALRGRWPPVGWPTGKIGKKRFRIWYKRIRNPRLVLFEDWYQNNIVRMVRGEKMLDPH